MDYLSIIRSILLFGIVPPVVFFLSTPIKEIAWATLIPDHGAILLYVFGGVYTIYTIIVILTICIGVIKITYTGDILRLHYLLRRSKEIPFSEISRGRYMRGSSRHRIDTIQIKLHNDKIHDLSFYASHFSWAPRLYCKMGKYTLGRLTELLKKHNIPQIPEPDASRLSIGEYFKQRRNW